jgi:hypothetical protein
MKELYRSLIAIAGQPFMNEWGEVLRYDEEGLRNLCMSINAKLSSGEHAEIIDNKLYVTISKERIPYSMTQGVPHES